MKSLELKYNNYVKATDGANASGIFRLICDRHNKYNADLIKAALNSFNQIKLLINI